jgi:hypothetical protein
MNLNILVGDICDIGKYRSYFNLFFYDIYTYEKPSLVLLTIKWKKKKKYLTVEPILQSTIKIIERGKIDTQTDKYISAHLDNGSLRQIHQWSLR